MLHRIETAETALGFVEGRTRIDLDTDTMLRFALVRELENRYPGAAEAVTR